MADDSHSQLALDTAAARVAALSEHPLVLALREIAARERPVLVGGALRDAALGRPVADLDAVVARDGERLAGALSRRIGGRAIRLAPGRFLAWRVICPAGEIDLWDLDGATLAADLRRRDLTVNAIGLDLAAAVLIDPHDGLRDLCQRRLRAVELSTFEDDPVRVLRLARFRVQLAGFSVDAETARAARQAAPGLDRVAGERIRDELATLAGFDRPAAAQGALAELAVYPGLWCGFEAGRTGHPEVEAFARFERALRALEPTDSPIESRVAAEHALRLRLAATGSEFAHADRLTRRAILSRRELRLIHLLLDRVGPPPDDDPALALQIWRAGRHWAEALSIAAALAASGEATAWPRTLSRARSLVTRCGAALLEPRPLLDGDQVAALLGLAPGPRVGAALRALVEAQVQGTVTDEPAARSFLRRGGWRHEGRERVRG